MKKSIKTIVLLFAITMLSMITVSASAYSDSQMTGIQLRYIGVEDVISTLYINSSGQANVYGRLKVNPGYSADVTVTLCKDSGSSVQSWSCPGGENMEIQECRYVASGHSYQVILSATIYNSSGRVVDTVTKDSAVVRY